jgi:general secretion pathway protein K
MSEDVLNAIAPLVTVFGEDKVNALTASPEVLLALPGMTQEQVDSLLDVRQHSPIQRDKFSSILGQAANYVLLEARPVARVEITARLIDGYAEAARATIVVVPKDKAPYRILAWTPASQQGLGE